MKAVIVLMGVLLLIIAFWSVGELILDAHRNGQQAKEGTKRAGRVEIRED